MKPKDMSNLSKAPQAIAPTAFTGPSLGFAMDGCLDRLFIVTDLVLNKKSGRF